MRVQCALIDGSLMMTSGFRRSWSGDVPQRVGSKREDNGWKSLV
jgi:hypothetical protein